MAIKVGQSGPLRRNYVVGKADEAKRSIAGAGVWGEVRVKKASGIASKLLV